MGIPQILIIILFTLQILVAIINHGRIKTDVRRTNAFSEIFAVAIIAGILYAGGFWSQ